MRKNAIQTSSAKEIMPPCGVGSWLSGLIRSMRLRMAYVAAVVASAPCDTLYEILRANVRSERSAPTMDGDNEVGLFLSALAASVNVL